MSYYDFKSIDTVKINILTVLLVFVWAHVVTVFLSNVNYSDH